MPKITFTGDVSGILNGLEAMRKAGELTDDQFDLLQTSINDTFEKPKSDKTVKEIDNVTDATVKAGKAAKNTEKQTKQLGKEFVNEAKHIRSVDGAYELVTKTAKSYVKSLLTIPKGLKKGALAAKIFSRALIAIPIFAIIAAITGLIALFTKTQAGAEKLQRTFAGLSSIVSVVSDRLIQLGKALLNFKVTGIKGVTAAFKGMGDEMEREYRLARDLRGELQQIEKAQLLDEVSASKSKKEYERLKLLAEDTNNSLSDRIKYLKQAESITKRDLDNQLASTTALIKNQLGIKGGDVEGANKFKGVMAIIGEHYNSIADKAFIVDYITKQIGLSESTIGDFETLAERVKKVYEIQEESYGRQAGLISQINSFRDEAEDKKKKRDEEARKSIEAQQMLHKKLYEFVQGEIVKVDGNDKGARQKQVERVKNLKGEIQKAYDELSNLSIGLGVELDISQEDIDSLKSTLDQGLTVDVTPLLPTGSSSIDFDAPEISSPNLDEFQKGIDKSWDGFKIKDTLFNKIGIGGDSADLMDKSFASIKSSLTQLADVYVEEQQRIIDASNDRISTLEQDVAAEQELADQNINNNLEAKQKELAAEKTIRDNAIAEQKKVQQIQFAIDTATQASGLLTASVNIFKFLSKRGPIGVALAIGTIGAMLGAFAALKAKAYNMIKAEKGVAMKLKGNRHSEGGNELLMKDGSSTGIEAEKGEAVSVFSRQATRENWGLIQEFTQQVNSGLDVTLNPTKIVSINANLKQREIDLKETNNILLEQNKILSNPINRTKVKRKAI